MLTWVLVAVGGAAGSAVGLLLLRRPSPRRLLMSTAVGCALMGAFGAHTHSAPLTALLSSGFLGSAMSLVALGAGPPIWLDSNAILRSAWEVTKRLAVYCAVGVTFALTGYLALRGGTTLYLKLR